MSRPVERLASPFKHLLKDRDTTAQTFRWLLRDLLRETTYLPDPWLRTWYRSYIIQRYRNYIRDVPANSQSQRYARRNPTDGPKVWLRKSALGSEKQHSMFIHARQELRYLVRANIGHDKPLLRIMSRAYGRAGPRRWNLLKDLWKTDVPKSSDTVKGALQSLQDDSTTQVVNGLPMSAAMAEMVRGKEHGYVFGQTPFDPNWLLQPKGKGRKKDRPKPIVPELPTPIKALVKAQLSRPLPALYHFVKVKPVIPQTNAWGRPFPVKRTRNLIAEWFFELKRGLLPSLPTAEFDRLVKLTTGDCEGMVTPVLSSDMPPIVKTREYGSPFFQPRRRPLGTVRHQNLPRPKWLRSAEKALSRDRWQLDFETPGEDELDDEDELKEQDGESLLPLNSETVERNLIGTLGAHYLEPRFLRGLYRLILDLSSRMEDKNGTPSFVWGRPEPEWKQVYQTFQAAKRASGRARSRSTDVAHPAAIEPVPQTTAAGKRAPQDAWLFRAEDPMEARPTTASS